MNNTERSYKFLVDIGYGDLVDIIKFITNNNPYSSDIIQHKLWNEFANKNIPFLICLSNLIYNKFLVYKIQETLFTTRDCIFLKQIYNKIYPQSLCSTFYSSRALLQFPTDDYVFYVNNKFNKNNTMLVDLQGSGQSFVSFMYRYYKNIGPNSEPLYFLVNWNSRVISQYNLNKYKNKFIVNKLQFWGDSIEKLNIDLIGTYFDFYNSKPISYIYEYNISIIESIHKCFYFFLSNIHNFEILKQYNWNNNFSNWFNQYYVNPPLEFNINWTHTHFKLDKENIDKLRIDYRNEQNKS